MFGRKLRSPLDNIRPSLERKVYRYQERQKATHDSHARCRNFELGDAVYVRNYASGNQWLPGKVVKKLGSTMYAVLLDLEGRSVREHTDQMRHRMVKKSQNDCSNEKPSDDTIEMRVPRTEMENPNESIEAEHSSDSNDSTNADGGTIPPVSETVDTSDSSSQEQGQNR